jgi:hypothetical protein
MWLTQGSLPTVWLLWTVTTLPLARSYFPGSPNSRDTVTGVDGQSYTSDQATIWRWREAFQHDFSARMDWTMKDFKDANHNPVVVVNGDTTKEPIFIRAKVGTQ